MSEEPKPEARQRSIKGKVVDWLTEQHANTVMTFMVLLSVPAMFTNFQAQTKEARDEFRSALEAVRADHVKQRMEDRAFLRELINRSEKK